MSYLLNVLRSNPHFLNFVVLGTAFLLPVGLYAYHYGPTTEDVERTIVRRPLC